MLSPKKPLAVTALFLAVASIAFSAQAQVSIPGLNSAIGTPNDPAPAAQAAPAAQPAQPAASQVPAPAGNATNAERTSGRLISVTREVDDLPSVPTSVLPPRRQQPSEPVETRQDVVVSNGTNTLIPISRGQINRIVTPFEDPVIQTVSSAEITTSENVIYVTTQENQPVTMFITPADDEGVAISLTLFPQQIPPIQANLIFSQSVPGSAGAAGAATPTVGGVGYSGQARRWERSQPFIDTLRSIMRELALGNLPRGYSFAELQSGDTIPDCIQPGVDFDFSEAQYILGHDFRVYVAVAKNVTDQHLEVSHNACSHPNRAAAAIWPHEIIEPGQKTEVFLVTRVPQNRANTSTRPSLLN